MSTKSDNKILAILKEYIILTLATIPMIVGVYVFKFPNHFTFAGVTGISVLLVKVLPSTILGIAITESTINLFFNIVLLILAFIILGKSFGIKTVYVTLLSSLGMKAMEYIFPSLMKTPLTDSMEIELVFAILLPAVSTAILMSYGASAGGTEIVAMIFKKFTSWNISVALFVVDFFVTFACFFLYGMKIGLFSAVGLIAKSLVINNVIASMHMAKMFTIICNKPDEICDFIATELHRTATKYDAEGAYSHQHKTVLISVMNRKESIKLRKFINEHDEHAFMMITSSSEIFGGGFHSFN